ncbi:MAG TPA: hypothetical protein VNY83_01380 [Solirubrobacterales bacterium]|jgi:hypothetical protein|nr:hypothetical protein [Solirubrobacterales bacterium]
MSESTTQVSDESRLCEWELTRHLRLVLDNDSELYEHRRAIVREHLAARDECPFCNGSGFKGEIARLSDDNRACDHCVEGQTTRYPHQLGDRLKDWCEGLVGLHSPNVIRSNGLLATEVLSTALAWVDWTELANDYIEEERES